MVGVGWWQPELCFQHDFSIIAVISCDGMDVFCFRTVKNMHRIGAKGECKLKQWTVSPCRLHAPRGVHHIEVTKCFCGGELKVISAITEYSVISKILDHVGISAESPEAHAARPPPNEQFELGLF
mgnify:CR=1 FL=1